MLAILGYFLVGSALFLAQQFFLWSHLEQLHTLGLRLPLFTLLNNFIVLSCLVACVRQLVEKWALPGINGKRSWVAILLIAGIVSVAFTLMDTPYFLPATYQVFRLSSGKTWSSVLNATIAVLTGELCIALVRWPIFVLAAAVSLKQVWVRMVLVLVLLLGLHLVEPVLLVTVPVLYPLAFQLPVVLKPNLVASPSVPTGVTPRVVFLFNPNITYRIRQQVLYVSGNEGYEAAGRLFGIEIRAALEKIPANAVTVILPEVVIETNEAAQVNLFAQSFGAEVQPYAKQLELLVGVSFKDLNLILHSQWHKGQQQLGVVRQKSLPFPFFETPLLGIDLRGPTVKNQQITLPKLDLTTLAPYAQLNAFDICYEALYLRRWHVGTPKLVLTNHGIFFDQLVISKSYDLLLQTLGTVFQTPLIFVGNRGGTGAFVADKDWAKVQQFFTSPQELEAPLPVRFVEIVGF